MITFGEAFGDVRSRSETFSTRRACFGGAVRLRPFILLSSSPNTSPVLSAEIKSSNSPLLSAALLFLLFFFSGTGWLLWMSFLAADLWRSRSFCWKVKQKPLRLVSGDTRAIAGSTCDWSRSLGNQQKHFKQWFSVLVLWEIFRVSQAHRKRIRERQHHLGPLTSIFTGKENSSQVIFFLPQLRRVLFSLLVLSSFSFPHFDVLLPVNEKKKKFTRLSALYNTQKEGDWKLSIKQWTTSSGIPSYKVRWEIQKYEIAVTYRERNQECRK